MPSPELTEEQDSKYTELLSLVSKWSDSFHGHPLEEQERLFLTRECLLRYLRASKWDVGHSLTRLEATLLWRRERHIDDLGSGGQMNDEIRTGRLIPLGHDNNGRPCLYFDLSKETPKLSEIQMDHLCFMTERIIDMMQPGIESITVIIDLNNVSRNQMPSIAKVRAYITAFQEHNPERLGLVIVPSTVPWWFYGIWRVIRYFLDPAVKDKIILEGDWGRYVSKDKLWTKYGGDMEFELDHDTYWTRFLDEAGKRRGEYVRRWESCGNRTGESEISLRGGDVTSNEWIFKN